MSRNGTITLAMTLVFTMACHRSEPPTMPHSHDGKRTYEEYVAMVQSFPYTATPERRKRILDNYPKLSVGMSKEQVAALMGEPDFSQESASKDFESKIKGSFWSYNLYDLDDNVNEKQDQEIEVFYDAGDRVDSIVPRNIEGLPAKGSPSNRGS